MARNYVQPGKVIDVVAIADVTSGEFYVQDRLFGVAITSAKAGEIFSLQTEGVFRFPNVNNLTSVSIGATVFRGPAGFNLGPPSHGILVGIEGSDILVKLCP